MHPISITQIISFLCKIKRIQYNIYQILLHFTNYTVPGKKWTLHIFVRFDNKRIGRDGTLWLNNCKYLSHCKD